MMVDAGKLLLFEFWLKFWIADWPNGRSPDGVSFRRLNGAAALYGDVYSSFLMPCLL